MKSSQNPPPIEEEIDFDVSDNSLSSTDAEVAAAFEAKYPASTPSNKPRKTLNTPPLTQKCTASKDPGPSLDELLHAQEELRARGESLASSSSSASVNPATPTKKAEATRPGYFEFHEAHKKKSIDELMTLACEKSSTTEVELIQKMKTDWKKDKATYLLFIDILRDHFLIHIGYHVSHRNCAEAIFTNNCSATRERSIRSLNKTLLTGILYSKQYQAEVRALQRPASSSSSLSPANSDTIHSLTPSSLNSSKDPMDNEPMLTLSEFSQTIRADEKSLAELIYLATEYSSDETISLLEKLVQGWDNKEDYLQTIALITGVQLPEDENEFILDAKFIFNEPSTKDDKTARLDELSKRVVLDLLHEIYSYLALSSPIENTQKDIQQELSNSSVECSPASTTDKNNSSEDDNTVLKTPPKKEAIQQIPDHIKAEIKRRLLDQEKTKASKNPHSFMAPTASSERKTRKFTPANLQNNPWK